MATALTSHPPAHVHSPPHVHSHSHSEWKDYRHLHPRYRTSVEALRSLAKARLMSQLRGPSEHLDVEISVDSPFLSLQGRDNMRAAQYIAKWLLAAVDLKPLMYKVRELDDKRTRLELLVEAHMSPHRPWWLPATWLLPKTFTLSGDLQLRISKGPASDGSQDVITALEGRLHNLGKLPLPIRLLNGAVLGYLPSATETFWSPFVGLLGDPSYRQEAAAAAAAEGAPTGILGKAKAAASAVVDKAQETVAAVTEGGVSGVLAATGAKAAEQVQGVAAGAAGTTAVAAEKAAGAADAAAAKVGNGGVKGKAAEAVRGAVHDVAGAVKGGVAAGAEKVTEVAGKAKKAVVGQA